MSPSQPHIHSDIKHSDTTPKTEQLYSDTLPRRSSGPFSSKLRIRVEEQSTSQDNESISYADAKVGRYRFDYWKIESSRVPKGWSNDPLQLDKASSTPFSKYNLDPPTLPVLASDTATTPRRYLVWHFGHFFFWIPSTPELLYVTECYSLEGVLQRISDGYELQTKSLDPRALQSNQHDVTYLPLWFWQIPYGWSQDVQKLEDLKDIVSGQEYGLPPLIPILVSVVGRGGTEYFIKSGEEFYLYYHISSQLVHIDKPSGLRDILSVLGPGSGKELETTDVNYLPEYGGPNVVADDNVPVGWSNKIDKTVSCTDLFPELELCGRHLLLFWDGGQTDTPKYLVEGDSGHYIWDTTSNDVWRIVKAQGLQDILDILKDESRHLTVSRASRLS